jgi:periplasmic divalent cation tolerance protein
MVVVTTVGTLDAARALARALVERKLAACAQISVIESFYEWKGALENDAEFRVWFKTMEERYGEVEAAIRELHPYELPAIYALPVVAVFAPYADWVEAGSGGGAPL